MSSAIGEAAGSGRAIAGARAAGPITPSRRVALRVTLQVILLGLLLTTVLIIGIVNYLSARRTTDMREALPQKRAMLRIVQPSRRTARMRQRDVRDAVFLARPADD